MKRKLTILIALLMCCNISFAQIEKGNYFVAGYGHLNVKSGKDKTKSGSSTYENNTFTDFEFNPVAGYFLIDKLPVGLFIDAYTSSEKTPNYKTKSSQYAIGPFVRYYILEIDKLYPYAEGRIGIGQYITKYGDNDNEKSTYTLAQLGIGASYFFAKHLALDGILGYSHKQWSYKSSEEGGVKSTQSTSSKVIDNSLMFRIGILITFGNTSSREKALPCPEDK